VPTPAVSSRAPRHEHAPAPPYHRGHLESVIYIVKGRARMLWGGHLEFTAETRPGDFVCVQPEHVLWIEETHQKGRV